MPEAGIYTMLAPQLPMGLSLTALCVATVVAAAAIAMISLGEHMSPIQMSGVAVAVLGVALVKLGLGYAAALHKVEPSQRIIVPVSALA